VHRFDYNGAGDAVICRIVPPADASRFASVFFYMTVDSTNDVDFQEPSDADCTGVTGANIATFSSPNLDSVGENVVFSWLPELSVWSRSS
jgi:hypothetical protein